MTLPAWSTPESLKTTAEKTDFQQTGRYAEVLALCEAFAKTWPAAVRVETFGTTPQGRPMLALVVSRTGALNPEQAQKADIPVMLMQGGIHAGEIDGKDAGFWALRDLLETDDPLLKELTLVFVPVFNVDGHERFGAWNRPNQIGPLEMGWRVTSQNLNLNRDYGKADAPEMVAMLGLLNRWDPILYVDLHVTDGAQFQPDIAILVEPIFIGDATLHAAAKTLQETTLDALKAAGSKPLPFYPSLVDYGDPASGFSDSAYTPRFSTGYWPLRNRLAVLVETHSWKNYGRRVKATHQTILELARATARDGKIWKQQAASADKRATTLGGSQQTLTFETTQNHTMIDFEGYAYKREPSAVSGSEVLVYDAETPETWHIPFYDEVIPKIQVVAPRGGYLIPAAHSQWMTQRLKTHGIEFAPLVEALNEVPLEVFRAESVAFGKKSSEGHMTAVLTGDWSPEVQSMMAGSLYVPIAQPKARLVMALLEPQAPDSYAAWGFFNAHFEIKEYMEDYVSELVAREILVRRPEVAREFQKRLATDPEFAKSPEARLEFFYRQSPSWDESYNLYPIMRTDALTIDLPL